MLELPDSRGGAVNLAHEEAFLADIVEHRDDVRVRLIYADWLEERGQSRRADFIRLQIELASDQLSDERRGYLLAQEQEILAHHEHEWRSQLPQLDGVTWEEFSRGFVESVFVETVEAFERQAEAIFAAAPICRLRIGLLDVDSTIRLARLPQLARLTELNVGNNPSMGRGIHALMASPHLSNLRVLLLHYNDLGDHAMAVADSSAFTQLTELYLSGNQLTDHVVARLARCRWLSKLQALDLRDNQLNDGGICSLTFHGLCLNLKTFWLVNNQLREGAAWALAASIYLPTLNQLYLNYNPIGSEGASAFAESRESISLQELDLRHCGIGNVGGLALAESPYCEALDRLWLGGNRLGSATLTALRRRFGARLRL